MSAPNAVMAPSSPNDRPNQGVPTQLQLQRQELIDQVSAAVAPESPTRPAVEAVKPMSAEKALAWMALYGVNTEKLLAAHTQAPANAPTSAQTVESALIQIPEQRDRITRGDRRADTVGAVIRKIAG